MGLDYVSVLKQNYKIIIINRAAFINLNNWFSKTWTILWNNNTTYYDRCLTVPDEASITKCMLSCQCTIWDRIEMYCIHHVIKFCRFEAGQSTPVFSII
jgi:hypothetical protein